MPTTILRRPQPHAQSPKVAQVEPVSGSGLSALRMAERIASRFTQFAELASSGIKSQPAHTSLAKMKTVQYAWTIGGRFEKS